MTPQHIQQLIERFLDADTSLDEEHQLYAYFQQPDVPEALQPYQEMFRGYAALAPRQRKRRSLRRYLPYSAGIAASLALVWGIGSGILRSEAQPVCYTLEHGQRITDKAIVMSHVENTLNDIFASDNLSDVEHQMEGLFNFPQSDTHY